MESIMGKSTQFDTIPGYLAQPSGEGPWPGLVVIQEWWGLDDQTKSIADRFARAGYMAFAPDLYHGELAPIGDGEKARVLVQKYGPTAPDDLENIYDAFKQDPGCSGKVGAVGFCFGGRMALSLAIRRPLDAVCTFYGGGMQQIFDQLREKLSCPVLGLFGDADGSIPVGTVEEFDRLLDQVGVEHEVVVYPDSGHAFFRDSDPDVYRPEAARDAWERVTSFFETHLK
jgi:carboxymethylenebutenolidase